MSDLIAITYKGQKAFDALAKLGELQKMKLIELEDAAVATMDAYASANLCSDLSKTCQGGFRPIFHP
jgi:uncharacterized membrane protein